MTTPLRIGIAGLGNVGAGALKILIEQADMLEERCGRRLEVTGVSARDHQKKRGVDIGGLTWVDDPLALAADANVDVVVEVIGGEDGVAKAVVEKALSLGKPVVTANKALIAHHGAALAALAEKNNAVLAFEAAVAGGIPIVKALRDGLSANFFIRIAGILNGTCNYILTQMGEQRLSFEQALKSAQIKGYAEADPGFDISGADTAHKLAILASLAYGVAPAADKVQVQGIENITLSDIAFAGELGYVIKLLGLAAMTDGGLAQRVHPCLVGKGSPLANVGGALNAILIEGDSVGQVMFEGAGAGAGPTGSSVVADLMDIARGVKYKPLTLPAASLKKPSFADMSALKSSYYLRLDVIDRPGVLAEVTGLFKQEHISLRSFLQHSHKPGETVQVVLTTHPTRESAMARAAAAMAKLESVKDKPCMLRIENL